MSILTPQRYLLSMHKTPVLLNALLKGVTQEQAQTLTDGPDGWTTVETMCHIRDFADVSLTRAQSILSEDNPLLPNFDPQEGAKRRNYPCQNLAAEFAAYLDSRKALLALLDGITEEQWQRRGVHSSYGPLTLLDLLVHIEWHDVNHMEQIARTLKLSEPLL